MKLLNFCLVLISSAAPLYCAMPALSAQEFDNFLKSLTEEDIAAMMADLEKMNPQELAELERVGREALSQMGIDPDTLQQAPPTRPTAPASPAGGARGPSIAPAASPAPAPAKPKEALAYQPSKIAKTLTALTHHLESLLDKYHTYPALRARLNSVILDIVTLNSYSRVLNTSVHHERLASKKNMSLAESLIQLEHQMGHAERHINPHISQLTNDDPYFILHSNPKATDEQLTSAYERLIEPLADERVRERLQAAGASEKEIHRGIRAAHMQKQVIQQAYQQVHNPLTRQQLDHERERKLEGTIDTATAAAITQCIQALELATGPQHLTNLLSEYLKEYAPEKAALIKEQQEHEAARLKEHKEFLQMRPQLTRGSFDPQYKPAPEGIGASQPSTGARGAGRGASSPAPRQRPSLASTEGGPKPGERKPGTPGKPGSEKPASKDAKKESEPAKKSGDTKPKSEPKKIEDVAGTVMLGLQKLQRTLSSAPYSRWSSLTQDKARIPLDELTAFEKDSDLAKLTESAQAYKKSLSDASKETQAHATLFVESMMERFAPALQSLKTSIDGQKNLYGNEPLPGSLTRILPLVENLYKAIDSCAQVVLKTGIKDLARARTQPTASEPELPKTPSTKRNPVLPAQELPDQEPAANQPVIAITQLAGELSGQLTTLIRRLDNLPANPEERWPEDTENMSIEANKLAPLATTIAQNLQQYPEHMRTIASNTGLFRKSIAVLEKIPDDLEESVKANLEKLKDALQHLVQALS